MNGGDGVKVLEFRVVVNDKDDSVSSSYITRALQSYGVSVEYVEIQASYNEEDEDECE
jgi:hypothetical protein